MRAAHELDVRTLVGLWVVLGALSVAFAWTDGLAYVDIPSIQHVSGLQSSGSDDDLCVEGGALLATLALGWSVLRARRRPGLADVAVHAALVALQVGLLAGGVEAGSIAQTVVRDHNGVLVAWLATLGGLAGALAVLLVRTSAGRGPVRPR